MDEKTYKQYKQMIANAIPKIDNKPPRFKVSTYYKTRDLIAAMNRMQQLDKENMVLLRNMNVITRLCGKVDCWLRKINYRSNLDDPDRENKKLVSENKLLLQRIRSASTKYPTIESIQNWREMKQKTAHKRRYPEKSVTGISEPYHQDHCMVKDMLLLKSLNPLIRTKCFFEVEIQGENQKLGYILFELYDDIVPRTCTNFAELCRGNNGLSYKNTPFHRIVSGYWCQGGDVTKFNGSGGTSIYGESFENENYNLCHAGPGVLSMCSGNENRSNSKFNLTFKRLETVDGRYVVFGKVIAGLSNIYKIEEFGTKTGKPFKTIIVSNCGVMPKSTHKKSSRISKVQHLN